MMDDGHKTLESIYRELLLRDIDGIGGQLGTVHFKMSPNYE